MVAIKKQKTKRTTILQHWSQKIAIQSFYGSVQPYNMVTHKCYSRSSVNTPTTHRTCSEYIRAFNLTSEKNSVVPVPPVFTEEQHLVYVWADMEGETTARKSLHILQEKLLKSIMHVLKWCSAGIQGFVVSEYKHVSRTKSQAAILWAGTKMVY